MPEPTARDENASTPKPAQSGAQIWLVCVLFILVPALFMLVVKYLLKL